MPLTAAQSSFIDTVLRLAPRVVAFDCDGTLWDGDSGVGFFYWELKRGLIPPDVQRRITARYDEYLAGRVGEEDMCGEMVTIHAGIDESRLYAAAREYLDGDIARKIFPEMLELAHRLRDSGAEVWAVSSTNNWVVEVGVERFGIPRERVLAASVYVEDGIATDRLRQVPSGEGKAVALREALPAPPDAAFGNSIHDAAMLALARHAFCINPNPDLIAIAKQNGWTVYWPAARE